MIRSRRQHNPNVNAANGGQLQLGYKLFIWDKVRAGDPKAVLCLSDKFHKQ